MERPTPTGNESSAIVNTRNTSCARLPTRQRWAEVVAYGFVGAILVVLASHGATHLFRKAEAALHLVWDAWLIAAGVGGVAFAVWSGSLRREWRRLTNLPKYPPAWAGACFGTFLVLMLGTWQAESVPGGTALAENPWCALAVAGVILAAPFLLVLTRLVADRLVSAIQCKRSDAGGSPNAVTRDRAIWNFPTLTAWLRTDLAVVDPNTALFEHRLIAGRIARRLGDPSGAATVALIGPYGSGKTTMRHLVEHELGQTTSGQRVEIAAVSLWPYETPEGAVRGILDRLIAVLSTHVTPLPLAGIGRAYVDLVGAIDSRLAGLVNPNTPEPASLIERINAVAATVSLRLCVWIEDIERFAGTPDDPRQQNERLSPIRALLHLLEQQDHLTVVVASTELDARFDIEKIARFVESIPDISHIDQHAVLRVFRTGCLAADAFVDPASSDQRRELSFSEESLDRTLSQVEISATHLSIATALCTLCRTPRTLKQGLRECLETWQVLRGEIDFDDVLALSLLKVAQPQAFALLITHRYQLRYNSWKDRDQVQTTELKEGISRICGSEATKVWTIVSFLFDPMKERHARRRPQGVQQVRPRDYLARYLSVPELDDSERDQIVLAALNDFDRKRSDLARWLCEEGSGGAVLAFESRLNTDQVLQLVDTALAMLTHRGVAAQHDYPGLVYLWRMLTRRRNDLNDELLLRQLVPQMRQAVEHNLDMASKFAYHFATWENDIDHNVFSKRDTSQKLAEQYWQALAETYIDKPDELVAALDKGHRWTLLWCCAFDDRNRRPQKVPSEVWPAFASTVLRAATTNPTVMVPQIATLVSDSAGPTTYVFQKDVAETLFDFESFAQVFATTNPADYADDPTVEQVVRGIVSEVTTR